MEDSSFSPIVSATLFRKDISLIILLARQDQQLLRLALKFRGSGWLRIGSVGIVKNRGSADNNFIDVHDKGFLLQPISPQGSHSRLALHAKYASPYVALQKHHELPKAMAKSMVVRQLAESNTPLTQPTRKKSNTQSNNQSTKLSCSAARRKPTIWNAPDSSSESHPLRRR